MSRIAQNHCAEAPRKSLYDEVTAKIVAELEEGIVPWVQPWGSGAPSALGLPRNAASGRAYSGINILILWGRLFDGGFASQNWLTFRQATALGGSVRKGERGVGVCYANRFAPKERRARSASSGRGSGEGQGRGQEQGAGEEACTIPFLRRYTVFNVAQCEGLPDHSLANAPELPEWQIVPEAEALTRATLADIRHGGDQAFYDPVADIVQLPPQPAFFDQINYYRTKFHELGHWTGHHSRLDRDQTGAFGSKLYAIEELVAELTAAFVCATLSIQPTVRHVDYIGNWIDVLRADNRAVFRAASKASKAADLLLSFRSPPAMTPEREGEPSTP
ncbi:ArdC family protein [Bradyrhizobium sp. AZCC 2230]|uniref:ArdC family protein n=1 Tax=Bradyrhizobium sp. AZCC 2230 TaxID=3117021 RepID=UPI002FEE6C3D